MIRRSALLATAIALSSFTVSASKASAEDLVVPFEANIDGSCNLNLIAPGVLARDFSNSYAIAAGFEGGQFAQVEADCNTPAEISASAPVQTAGPELVLMSAESYLIGGSTVIGPAGNNMAQVFNGPNFLEVDMYLESETPITSGDYGFEVTLTATPN
ncbi:hypothetical protein IQ260_05080 [Leptolyngbya cf. ectocarpi LEGE 11479]|uniref:DUF4402 domain-containing protein n=1 Tax=Leptolyngbya cf. ectocarpi LEGE 11479 TaxID=1828722 RepID=A0A928X1D0_LEPEC|nr:hypothetical protein [Leptolyngbya ectocarpi]MBE9066021.1 hypothetical protein [Leptolyngbya cf. ectocarpi LEGE 11479]